MTSMKKTLFLLSISLFFFSPVLFEHVSFAQRTLSECSDGKDNDGDTMVDTKGLTASAPWGVSQTAKPDPQCVEGFACEDGTSNCLSTNPVTTSSTDTPNTVAPNATSPGTSSSQVSDFPLHIRLQNPLKVDSIEGAISLFMDAVIKIAIPFIVVFFIWSGINFILAQGNPEKLKVAKKMFLYTVIGTLLILGAWAITDAIVGTINSIAS